MGRGGVISGSEDGHGDGIGKSTRGWKDSAWEWELLHISTSEVRENARCTFWRIVWRIERVSDSRGSGGNKQKTRERVSRGMPGVRRPASERAAACSESEDGDAAISAVTTGAWRLPRRKRKNHQDSGCLFSWRTVGSPSLFGWWLVPAPSGSPVFSSSPILSSSPFTGHSTPLPSLPSQKRPSCCTFCPSKSTSGAVSMGH
jgi:hypothetical protein